MSTIDYGIILVYLTTIVLIGLRMQRKAGRNIDSYFLGEKKLPWWALASSGMSSNLDISGTMIIAALIYALGAKGFYIEIRGGVTLIMAFLMIYMGKWNRRSGAMTLAEWMKLRFGEGAPWSSRQTGCGHFINHYDRCHGYLFCPWGWKIFGPVFRHRKLSWTTIGILGSYFIDFYCNGLYGCLRIVWGCLD